MGTSLLHSQCGPRAEIGSTPDRTAQLHERSASVLPVADHHGVVLGLGAHPEAEQLLRVPQLGERFGVHPPLKIIPIGCL